MHEPTEYINNRTIVRVVIYARISDRKQLDGASLETQVSKCTEYALSRGWYITKVVQELHTGTEYRERKLLSQIREMIRNGEVDILLVNSLDRLSREMIHQAVIMDELQHHNTNLVSVTEDIDNSPLGQFLRQALGFAAAVEREKFLERSKRTIEKRVREGKMIGAGTSRYGYDYNEDHSQYIINKEESKVIEHIYDLRLAGHPCRRIAIMLNQEGIKTRKGGNWTAGVVYKILHNPEYTGQAQAYRILYARENGARKTLQHPNTVDLPEGTIPAIISKEKFNAVQILLENAKWEAAKNNGRPEECLLRSGYLKCGYCGNTLTVGRLTTNPIGHRSNGNTYERKTQYRCQKATRATKGCTGVGITSEIIDKIVWEYIGTLLNDLTDIKQALSLLKGRQQEYDLAAIQRSIEKAKEEQEQLAEDIKGLRGNARIVILNQLNGIEERLERLEKEKAQAAPKATEAEKQQQEIDRFLAWAEEMKECYHEATYEEKRRALRVLGITVYLYKEKDPDKERYEIKVGLTNLCSNIA